jgi:23S rRNA-/tRNA-specific pseudouridylate synthase
MVMLYADVRIAIRGMWSWRCCRQPCGFLSSSWRNVTTLSKRISDAYDAKQTDGILDLLKTEHNDTDLWEAIMECIESNKPGIASSILNTVLASYSSADAALGLYERAYNDKRKARAQIQPDLVTFCLLADILRENKDLKRAGEFLELARRYSEKNIPGSRKERTSARRNQQRFASFHEAEAKLTELLGQDFSVLFENESFAVINKPPGISCTPQPSKKRVMDLPTALIQTTEPISSINRCLVHRLDKDTSGCMIVPKTDGSHAMLVRMFFLRRIDKSYECIVEPSPAKDSGTISIPVDSRPAESAYKILQRYGKSERALLEMTTSTGRKHQVRVHCARGLLCPIVGDSLYSSVPGGNSQHLYLHASRIAFNAFGEHVDVKAPRPSFWCL